MTRIKDGEGPGVLSLGYTLLAQLFCKHDCLEQLVHSIVITGWAEGLVQASYGPACHFYLTMLSTNLKGRLIEEVLWSNLFLWFHVSEPNNTTVTKNPGDPSWDWARLWSHEKGSSNWQGCQCQADKGQGLSPQGASCFL